MEEIEPIKKWFLELTLGTKRTTPHARAQKSMPEKSAFSWVPFCLRSQVCFERCDYLKGSSFITFNNGNRNACHLCNDACIEGLHLIIFSRHNLQLH